MSIDIFKLMMEVDDSDLDAKAAKHRKINDEIAAQNARNRKETLKNARATIRISRSIISMFRAFANLFGMQIDAMGQATLMMIQNIINIAAAYVALQTAMTVGTMGLAGASLAAATVSFMISVTTAHQVSMGVDVAKEDAQKAIRAIDATGGFIYALEGLL